MGRPSGRWGEFAPYFIFALLGIGLAVWQGLVYHHKTTGTVVAATVQDCRVDPVKGRAVTCVGTWPVAPAADRHAHGTVDGVAIRDIGRTVRVHLHGRTAYAQTLTAAPAALFFVGLLFALAWVVAAWRKAGKRRAKSQTPAGLPAG
jgi:hypothetical protein